MQRFSLRLSALLIIVLSSATISHGQRYDQSPLQLTRHYCTGKFQNPQRIHHRNVIKVTGIKHLDTAIVLSISGLQVAIKLCIPAAIIFQKPLPIYGARVFSAMCRFLLQKCSGRSISASRSMCRKDHAGQFQIYWHKKIRSEEIQGKIGLTKQTIITENIRRNDR